jgi:3-(3-hydroxy-phenyl)propionate hydroxylase
MPERPPLLIVGAGPVGLFTACQLVGAGQAVTVLEQNADLSEDMRASTFHPATLDLLDDYGLSAALIEQGTLARQWQYWIHGTDDRAVFDLDVIADLTAHPYRLQCEQFRLTRLIVERLADNPLFDLRLATTVKGLRHTADGVQVSARGPGGDVQLATPWLIAADGGRSTVRKLLQLPFEGSVFPKTSITLVLDYPFQDHVPSLLPVNYVWTDSAHYSLMRIRDLWRFTYSPKQDQPVEEALSEPVAQAHLQTVFPRPEPYRILQANHYTLHERCLESFRSERTLFVGDSAHLNSPAGGMGMNSGLHDARCLVEHLLPVLDGEADSLLDRYDRRRRTIAREEVQRLSARNYRRHRETDPGKRELIWRELRETVSDRQRMRDFLLESSMLASRQRELEIA